MATKTIRENFVNTFGRDLLIAYFDPGAGRNGAGRYNFASYSINDDRDWIKAIGALRAAACLFKLPMEASASVDIVVDTADPSFRTAFFVQIHRSSHLMSGSDTLPVSGNLDNDSAMKTLVKESLPLAESSFESFTPTCSVSESCGGRTTTACSDPIGTEAECVQLPTGAYEIVCVPRISPDPNDPGT